MGDTPTGIPEPAFRLLFTPMVHLARYIPLLLGHVTPGRKISNKIQLK